LRKLFSDVQCGFFLRKKPLNRIGFGLHRFANCSSPGNLSALALPKNAAQMFPAPTEASHLIHFSIDMAAEKKKQMASFQVFENSQQKVIVHLFNNLFFKRSRDGKKLLV
jgi:hypothetical protein